MIIGATFLDLYHHLTLLEMMAQEVDYKAVCRPSEFADMLLSGLSSVTRPIVFISSIILQIIAFVLSTIRLIGALAFPTIPEVVFDDMIAAIDQKITLIFTVAVYQKMTLIFAFVVFFGGAFVVEFLLITDKVVKKECRKFLSLSVVVFILSIIYPTNPFGMSVAVFDTEIQPVIEKVGIFPWIMSCLILVNTFGFLSHKILRHYKINNLVCLITVVGCGLLEGTVSLICWLDRRLFDGKENKSK